MLTLVMKTGDRLQIGDNVTILVQSESRTKISIDAPQSINIKRLTAKDAAKELPGKGSAVSSETQKKIVMADKQNLE